MPKKSALYKKENSPSIVVHSVPEAINKSGWIYKWTNYLKGYRLRWFVLDGSGNLSYYRNELEVGISCRGSINLQEARIHSDSATNSLIISASSQSFHLKAQNEIDRKEWLVALEYSRLQAIKQADSDEDDQNARNSNDNKKSPRSPKEISETINGKIMEMRVVAEDLNKHANELRKFLDDRSEEGRQCDEICEALKQSLNGLLKTSDELTSLVAIDCRNLSRYATNEHEQRLRLREQLETLAHQHSQLERVAFSNASRTSGNIEQPPYVESEEDNFYDANDDLDELRISENEGKSSSSRQESVYDEGDRDIFDADIIIDGGRTTMAEYNNLNQNKVVENDSKISPNFPFKKRRTDIPDRPHGSISLWSIMRNCIGKELSKIPMPVNFNEPLSFCQRITESDLEYAYLLDRAAEKTDSCEQICYVAAYVISCYSTTGNRTTKPFNPSWFLWHTAPNRIFSVLGETFECDRNDDLGWRSLAEQVSHHPPATAHHAEGKQWTMFQEITMTSRFRGKYLSVTPQGFTHVTFKNSGAHYTYRKITTTVHNIIVGKLWIDNHGEMVIENHKTGDKCILKFNAYSYFSSEKPRRVNGVVKDKQGVVRFIVQGFWDRHIDLLQVSSYNKHEKGEKNVLETLTPRRVWTINPPYKNSDRMYFFTKLAIELNEEDDTVAPTDSRRRPDQRLMEKGNWDEANRVKNEIEDKQRLVRRKRETEADRAMQAGVPFAEYKANWFEKSQDELTGSVIHVFKQHSNYWDHKVASDWKDCPDIF